MTRFEIINIGIADVERGTIVCNFNVTPQKFIRKYRNYLLKFPKSIIEVIKSAISRKNSKIAYKEIYYKTLTDFFSKIQKIGLEETNSLNASNLKRVNITDQNNFLQEALSTLSKTTKMQTFMERRLSGQNYPVEAENKATKISKKKIQSQIAKIILHVENSQYLEAKSIISSTITKLRYFKEMDVIENRLIICQNFIEFIEELQIIKNLINTNQFVIALNKTRLKINELEQLDLTIDLYNQIHQDYKQTSDSLEKEQNKAKNSILLMLNRINNLIQKQDYDTINQIFKKISNIAKNWNFTDIRNKISKMQTQIRNEQIVLSKILEFGRMQVSRIHITEIVSQTLFSETQVEFIIKNLISKKILRAKYDPITKGIEFENLNQEIDELMKNFQEWESSSSKKK